MNLIFLCVGYVSFKIVDFIKPLLLTEGLKFLKKVCKIMFIIMAYQLFIHDIATLTLIMFMLQITELN